MGPIDFIILAIIAVAFVAVCIRIKRRGSCADCGSVGSCSGHCSASQKKSCPACKGVDRVASELGRGVK
ncbi:hypothetical protein H6A18_00070 [Collinsella tanakaei]|uniref:hypothetical protein n=1 Tax=Collinsella tanakaei TaxID=626935 RepID=UPI001959D382|nr:hypothetical protein [Collinsella tanakaei]MBM6754938.1 hypothetical protein [Collinsella tanakaei]